ncbi:MAG: hypothetical protein LUD69_01925, partial [Oscillospiraceae bacterium]|nr:hypothetical protein [Oscillospiraceae bacterium]
MRTLKKCTSLLLVLAMVFSMVVTCAAAEDGAAEVTNPVTVEAGDFTTLKSYLTGSDYSSYDQLTIKLTANIEMTSAITSLGHTNVVIDGQSTYTLYGPSSSSITTAMFSILRLADTSLTFQNITIAYDSAVTKNQRTVLSFANASNVDVTFDGVTLNNLRGYDNTTYAAIRMTGSSAGTCTLNINNTVTTNCSGTLVSAQDVDVNITNSNLETTALMSNGSLLYVSAGTSGTPSSITITNSTLSVIDTTYSNSNYYRGYGVYALKYNNVTLNNTAVKMAGNQSTSYALYAGAAEASFTVNGGSFSSTGTNSAKIYLSSADCTLTTDGQVQGSPEVVLTSGAKILLTKAPAYTLCFSFSASVANTDPVVAGGTDSHALTESDLAYLKYAGSTVRTLKLGSDGCAYFYSKDATNGVHVTTAEELADAVMSEGYTEPLTIYLDNDITMTSDTLITTLPGVNVTINGQGHTLSAPSGEDITAGSLTMFTIPTTSGHNLTFQNITIDAQSQQFIYYQSDSGTLTLNSVTLKNGYASNSTTGAIIAAAGSANNARCSAVNLTGVTAENCQGTLLYAKYLSSLSVSNSTLSSASLTSATYVVNLASGSSPACAMTVSGSTISWTGDDWTYGIYMGMFWKLTVENSTISGPNPAAASIYCYSDYRNTLTLNSSTVASTDEDGHAVISYAISSSNSAAANLVTDGALAGEPEIVLSNNTSNGKVIQLTGTLQNTLYYSFNNSISGDKKVVVGTTAASEEDTGYTLTSADLAKLVYSDTDSVRTLKMDTTTETDAEGNTTTVDANSASLYRVNLADCGAELLGGAVDDSGDAVTATLYAYTAADGSTVYAADTTSVTETTDTEGNTSYTLGETTLAGNNYEAVTVPVYYATYHDAAVEPDVQITSGEKVAVSTNYTVAYSGDNAVEMNVAAGTVQAATATVTPKNDLTGDAVVLPYAVIVASYTDLGAEDAPVKVTVAYDSNSETMYAITVYYNEEKLVEGTDYEIVSIVIDSYDWLVNITIEGLGDYGGTYTLSVSIPGKDIMVQTVYNEEALNNALEAGASTIYLSASFSVDNVVTIDHDVTIDGQGQYTISAGELETTYVSSSGFNANKAVAILSVQSGSVTLTGLTVDGKDQARCLYVADGASVEVTGDSVLTGGGGSRSGEYGQAIFVDEGGAVTLSNCQVRDSYSYALISGDTTYYYAVSYPIYNLGTLNIQDGASLSNLSSNNSAIYNDGTLNMTGGTIKAAPTLANEYFGNETTGSFFYNTGTFNMSGGTI